MALKQNWFDNVEDRPMQHPGIKWMTTAFFVKDVKKVQTFYVDVFGMVTIAELPDEHGELIFARLRYRGINITLNREDPDGNGFDDYGLSPETSGNPVSFGIYMYVDDVKSLSKDLLEHGAKEIKAPAKTMWGDMRARYQDPFGFIWDIAESVD